MIPDLYDWLARGCPDGVPLRWLYDAWQRAVWSEFRYGGTWGAFDERFPWHDLYYEHDEYLVRRRP